MDAVFPASFLAHPSDSTVVSLSLPLSSQQSSRIFFLPLSRRNRSDDDDEDKSEDEYENENEEKDEVSGRMDGRVGDGDGRGAGVAGNSGNGRFEGIEEASVPRGKGVQDIAVPRDTRGT